MPSELTKSVKDAISNFVSLKTSDSEGYIAIDVLRSIRDEATLMMEYQTICDTFDSDPLRLFDDDDRGTVRHQVSRLKGLMKVISFSRNVTKEQTSIETVVEITKDKLTKNVKDSLRLTFSYERSQVPRRKYTSDASVNGEIICNGQKKDNLNCGNGGKKYNNPNEDNKNNDEGSQGTNITYFIDLSKDHMKKERLVEIHVEAVGLSPSIETAIPMELEDEGEDMIVEEFDDNGNLIAGKTSNEVHREVDTHQNDSNSGDDDDDDDDDDNNDSRDRFAAYVDPETFDNFMKWSGMNLNLQDSLFLLMTFPYYEHEWDIFGFLLECIFGGEDDESMETMNEEE